MTAVHVMTPAGIPCMAKKKKGKADSDRYITVGTDCVCVFCFLLVAFNGNIKALWLLVLTYLSCTTSNVYPCDLKRLWGNLQAFFNFTAKQAWAFGGFLSGMHVRVGERKTVQWELVTRVMERKHAWRRTGILLNGRWSGCVKLMYKINLFF